MILLIVLIKYFVIKNLLNNIFECQYSDAIEILIVSNSVGISVYLIIQVVVIEANHDVIFLVYFVIIIHVLTFV